MTSSALYPANGACFANTRGNKASTFMTSCSAVKASMPNVRSTCTTTFFSKPSLPRNESLSLSLPLAPSLSSSMPASHSSC